LQAARSAAVEVNIRPAWPLREACFLIGYGFLRCADHAAQVGGIDFACAVFAAAQFVDARLFDIEAHHRILRANSTASGNPT